MYGSRVCSECGLRVDNTMCVLFILLVCMLVFQLYMLLGVYAPQGPPAHQCCWRQPQQRVGQAKLQL